MISWTKLLYDQKTWGDRLRYASPAAGPIPKPVVVWNITPSCNLSCRHCYLDAKHPAAKTASVKEAEAKKVISDLARFGVPVILFSGGEPLLHKDIFRLAAFAARRGIRPVLSTNGTLITPAVARKIKRAGFRYVGVSVDGSPAAHDRLRGSRGSFERALSGVRNCRTAGLRTGLRFTLTRHNHGEVEFIFDLVRKEGINRLCVYHLVYSGRASMADDISSEEKREALGIIRKRTEDFHKNRVNAEVLSVDNHADGVWIYQKTLRDDALAAGRVLRLLAMNGGNRSGVSICSIGHTGDVYIDQFYRKNPLGSVFRKEFSEIWQDEGNDLLYRMRHRRQFIKGKCAACRFFTLCNGNMRSRAAAAYGDLWGEDPACYLSEDEIGDESALSLLGDDPRL